MNIIGYYEIKLRYRDILCKFSINGEDIYDRLF